ncbi:MAG: flagellin [SAR324 cluster bacterium]|nr:flagellin [SAR324 cluster bacterium]
MSMRINHNISSLNTQRQLESVNRASSQTLEHLSSGMKINKGSDGPAQLVISENMRAQVAGLNQAAENSETGISMVQTAEGALNEVNRLLTDVRQLAIHASNEGVNDEKMLQADQAEIKNALETIDRIANVTQFGTKRLLDGSRGANGVANGDGLQFVDAEPTTGTSPVSGYEVRISQVATKSKFEGKAALTQEIVDAGETLTLREGGKTVTFTTKKGESVETTMNEFARTIEQAGLKARMVRGNDNIIRLEHTEFGSEHNFSVSSSTAGVLSSVANVTEDSEAGQDVKGTINGEEGSGRGQILTGKRANPTTAGLSVRFSGETLSEPGAVVGTVSVAQNSLVFQIGANEKQTVAVSLKNMGSRALAVGVDNDSGFKALEDINVTNFKGAQDAIQLIDKAIEETSQTRAKLGAFQKNTLQSNLNNLRVASENLTAAESTIRDADMASEMANFTRNQIMTQSATAMLAQANQQPQSVLRLLGQ